MEASTRTQLSTFRAAMYAAFERRRDALAERVDALLSAGPVPSPAHLRVQPVHRRGWGSRSDALATGRMSVPTRAALLAAHPLEGGEPMYAVDASGWMRCDAQTSPGRGMY